MDDLFALRCVDLAGLRGQREGFFFFERGFLCVDLFGRFDADDCKKLLRFPTSCSARAVIAPIKFRHR